MSKGHAKSKQMEIIAYWQYEINESLN